MPELTILTKKPLPPGCFMADSFDGEGVFAFAAAPDIELLVVVCLGTAATGAGRSYL